VQLLMEDYAHFALDPTLLCPRLDSLREVRGHEVVGQWQEAIQQGRLDEAVTRLLCEHYDPIYLRSMGRNFAHFAAAPQLIISSGSHADMARVAEQVLSLFQIKPPKAPPP
jgi:tRNA 2-selenouridine synthase